jgi:hypothetical protein
MVYWFYLLFWNFMGGYCESNKMGLLGSDLTGKEGMGGSGIWHALSFIVFSMML